MHDLPTNAENIQELINGFLHDWQFPQSFGALDGCHIQVSPPKEFAVDYYCYKQFYSTVLLAICDYAYRFNYINVGAPGRNNDSNVFQRSILPQFLETHPVLKQISRQIAGRSMEPVILADSAFPLKPNFLKPCPDCLDLTPEQHLFNYQISRAHRVIENAFGHLKARFRILCKCLEFEIGNVPAIIQTCCTLHNLCEVVGDTCDVDWYRETIEPEDRITIVGENKNEACAIRDHLADYFANRAELIN